MSDALNSTEDLAAIALLDEPVRRRLYDWVVAQGHAVGREEAARSLGITRPLAAFHLDRLTEAGLLDASYQRLTGRTGPGAGRPARVYRRSEREIAVSLPARHYELAADLFAGALQKMGDGTPPPELADEAHAAGEQLARSAAEVSGASSGDSAGQRLFEILERAGYEPTKDDGTIRLRNCPFDALVDEHRPLVCGTNLAVAQGIIDGLSEANRPDFQARLDSQPGYCCVVFSPKTDAASPRR